jgi:3',5'-cyclic AMP phosphodiesterase CpdA
MFVLAHISDIHLPLTVRPRPSELIGKRGLGLVNWRWRRRHEHRQEVLDALLTDLAAQSPDHIAVTGDLVNVALPGEFIAGRDLLRRIGPPERVSFVPGNHDAYVRACLPHGAAAWRDNIAGDPAKGGDAREASFPFLRRRGEVALIGLSTAVPTGPFMASGRLGDAQLRRFDRALGEVDEGVTFRVILIHHPPTRYPGDRLKRLTDAAGFRDVLRRRGADLVLHGHIHVNALAWLDGPRGKIPSVSVPSASSNERGDAPAGYNLFRIARSGDGWNCEWIKRGFPPAMDAVTELERVALVLP